MQNRLVVCLCNLKPAKMRGIESQAMVMCASSPEKVEILELDPSCQPGDSVICDPFPHRPDQPFMNPKKKIWEGVAPVRLLFKNDEKNLNLSPFPTRICLFRMMVNAFTKAICCVFSELIAH
jgi:hypothetical protein